MRSWCDLSWAEKCKIEDGEAREFEYSYGYSFNVKQKVRDGKDAKENRDLSK